MTSIHCTYHGDGQTSLKHSGNNAEIWTDLPSDNGGKERHFSPTDLFASSLAACSLTIMGKMAESRGKSIIGTTVDVEKQMAADPRRVAKIVVNFTFPDTVEPEERKKYVASFNACPVHNSLGKDVEVQMTSN